MQVSNFQQVIHSEVRQLLVGREYPGREVVVLEPGDTLAAAFHLISTAELSEELGPPLFRFPE